MPPIVYTLEAKADDKFGKVLHLFDLAESGAE
jgi:hypothetical protein